MELETDLACIAEQERRLRFQHFDEDTAWALGSRLRTLAAARCASVTIEVRLARETVFFCAMPGTAPANADWTRRKRNTTELLARSSYAVGLSLRRDQASLQTSMGLPERDYASHGGSFPILTAGSGCIGSVTVSGLPQRDDHWLVAEALAAMLNVPLPEDA
jgi:uncharacterized protein (UPF0303 family)